MWNMCRYKSNSTYTSEAGSAEQAGQVGSAEQAGQAGRPGGPDSPNTHKPARTYTLSDSDEFMCPHYSNVEGVSRNRSA